MAVEFQADSPQYLMFSDDLTGLYNRRFYDRCYVEQTGIARENNTPLGLLLIDVDFFKDFNDRYGHHQGDAILAAVGRVIDQIVDMSGYPVRYGGDEFAALMPAVSEEEALEFAEALCRRVRELSFQCDGRVIKVSLSVGVAHFPDNTHAAESLFENADSALYAAKRQGRDRAVSFARTDGDDSHLGWLHRFPCPTLVGRSTPLGDLIDRLQAPVTSAVQWIVVGGDAGIGKTRLLAELRERCTRHGHTLLEAGTARGQVPFGMLLDALGSAMRERPVVAQHMAAVLTQTQMRQMVPLLPELARYSLLSATAAESPDVVGAAVHDDLLVRMLLGLCAQERVTLIADDAHLVDVRTLRVLERVDEAGVNLVVCLGVRDDEETLQANGPLAALLTRIQRRPSAVYLRLSPLGRDDVARMMESIARGSASHPSLIDLIHARSRGIPLLVEELLKFLIHRRVLTYRGANLAVAELQTDELPSETELLMEVRAAKAVPVRSAAAVAPRGGDGLLRSGATLHERYVIERTVARGGMSVVYRASIPTLGSRLVAIKEMLMPQLDEATRRRAVEQFQSEAHILARLDHPNLVEVIDFFEEDDGQYLVMSYVDGMTLEQWLREHPGGDVGLTMGWVAELCDVLGYLHAQEPPILFRDLKPANLMLDRHDRLRLIDFGIAQALDVEAGTRTYIKGAGTPGYAPVEQCDGGSTDARSDIYALGATAYTLLTGAVPPPSVAIMARRKSLTPPRAVNPSVPPELDRLVLEMMAAYPEERPQSAADVRMRLAAGARTSAGPRPRTVLTSGLALRVTAGADGGVLFPLGAREVLVGRGEAGQAPVPEHLVLNEATVSRRQFTLRWDETRRQYVVAHEPGATNRTLLNGAPVTQRAIGLGDEIRAGHFEAVLELHMGETSERPTLATDAARIQAAAPTGSGQETTGSWIPEVAFMLRVVAGHEEDTGALLPVAQDALIEGRQLVIAGSGTHAPCDLGLQDAALRGAQLRLVWKEGRLFVSPPSGKAAARVNGHTLDGSRPLADNDAITWGRTTLLFSTQAAPASGRFVLEHLLLPERTLLCSHALQAAPRLVIGRRDDADIKIAEPGVSRVHAALEFRDEAWWLHHLSQTNPTLVNGVRIPAGRMLAHGDEIQVSGGSVLRFIDMAREF